MKYIWRCGLKQSETPLRDLRSALWYTKREDQRITLFELDGMRPAKTDVVWRSLARRVIASDPDGLLGRYLGELLIEGFPEMIAMLEQEIERFSIDDASRDT